MKVLAFACIIFAVCISTSLQWTPYYDCFVRNKTLPVTVSLKVEGCHSFPCEFIDGTNLTAQLDFFAQTNARSLRTQVNVKTNTTAYVWTHDANACKSLSEGGCPLKKGKIARYHMNMHLSPLTAPFIPFWYEFKLLDGLNRVQTCFRLYGKFVKVFRFPRLE